MKKVIIILLVLTVSLTGLFAALIQIGPSARFNGDISNVEDYKSLSNYELGAEARVNISSFSLAANVLFALPPMSSLARIEQVTSIISTQ